MKAIKALFHNAKDLQTVIGKYIEEHEAMKKSIEKFQAEAVERAKERLLQQAREVGGVKVVTCVLPMTPEAAKDLAFKLRAAQPENMLCVIGSKHDNKPLLTVMATDDLSATAVSMPVRLSARLPN